MSTSRSPLTLRSAVRLALAAGFTVMLMALFAIPAFASSWKSQGTMTVSVTTSQGAESGFAIVDHSSTGNTLTFTFTNGGTVSGTSAAVELVVPSGWTAPSKTASTGTVAIASGATCTGSTGTGSPAIGTISGTGPYTIPINLDCGASAGFTLTYSNVTGPSAPASSGTETAFTTWTKGSTDTTCTASLCPIASSPVVQVSGAASTFTVTATTPQTAGTAFTVNVTALDANGITAVGYAQSAFAWSSNAAAAPDGTAAVIPLSAPSFVNGSASDSTFTFYKANQSSVKVTATDGSVTGSTSTIAVSPAPTSQFAVSVGLTQTAGTPFTVSVTAQDQFKNTTPSYTPTAFSWSSSATNSPAPNNTAPTIPSTTPTFSSGTGSCSFCFTLTNAGETPTISATDGSITGTSSAITVNPGAAASFSLVVNGGSAVTAGSAFDVALTALDTDGNVATGYAADGNFGWNTTATGNPTIPSDIPTFTAGLADDTGFILTNTGETPTISATDGGVSGVSGPITVSPGSGTQLMFTVQPSNAILYQTLSPAVQVSVEDSSGNVVAGATNSITLSFGATGNANAATLRGTTTQSAVNGVATFSNLALDQIGNNYTLTAAPTGQDCSSSPTLACDTSHSFDITGTAVTLRTLTPKFGPSSGTPIGGKPITIIGSGFGLKGNTNTQVFFGSTQSTGVAVLGPTSLTATVPAGTGPVHVTVVVPGMASSDPTTAASLYKYGPTLTNVTPNVFNPTATTHTVVVHGTNLLDGTPTVTFGSCGTGTILTSPVATATAISVTPPSSCSAGAVHVTVTTAGGTSDATQASSLFYYGPKVTRVTPNMAGQVTSSGIIITGANFGSTISSHFVPSVTSVAFGNTILTSGFTVASATSIKVASLPTQASGDPGAVQVVVAGSNGASDATQAASLFYFGPKVTRVSPTLAAQVTSTGITISGSNFGATVSGHFVSSVTSVAFGSTVLTSGFTVPSATTIKVATLPTQGSGDPGTVNVVVTGSGGSSPIVAGDKFNYAPVLTSVTPATGKLSATTFTGVTLSGKNLLGATQVVFGDVPVDLSGFCTSTTCTATLIKIPKLQMPTSYPSGTTVNVVVVSPAGQSALGTSTHFTFQ